MANHLIHALNFGDDKFGIGLPVATFERVQGDARLCNIIIPNFVTSSENTADFGNNVPCNIATFGDIGSYNFTSFVIKGRKKKYVPDFLGDDRGTLQFSNNTLVIVAVDDVSTDPTIEGRLFLLHAHKHDIEVDSNPSLNIDVVSSVVYTPGNFRPNVPTQVSSTTASYLTDVTTQTTTINKVTQVSTGSVIGSLKTVSKTASKRIISTPSSISTSIC